MELLPIDCVKYLIFEQFVTGRNTHVSILFFFLSVAPVIQCIPYNIVFSILWVLLKLSGGNSRFCGLDTVMCNCGIEARLLHRRSLIQTGSQ
jgi:hypothetical protein